MSLTIMGAGRHKRVMGDDSLPHAATGVFDTAGCRTTSFHDARVVGGRGGVKDRVTRTTRARGGGEWWRGRRGATVDDERRVTTKRQSTRWETYTVATCGHGSTNDPPGS